MNGPNKEWRADAADADAEDEAGCVSVSGMRSDVAEPVINCNCGFTIYCRDHRGKEVECPQCGNQHARKESHANHT